MMLMDGMTRRHHDPNTSAFVYDVMCVHTIIWSAAFDIFVAVTHPQGWAT